MSAVNWKVQGALNRQGEQTGVITSSVLKCVCAHMCVLDVLSALAKR